MKTQVCVTIDTEFSIGGAFADPERRRPLGEANVTCPVGGREQGLGFLLETFANHGVPATFFVETLQAAWFGDAPMGRIVERILNAGQDVQLHLHPCWTIFHDPDWRDRVRADPEPDDDMDGRCLAELAALIDEGKAALQRIGAPAPVAVRTGNLRADKAIYRAMKGCGVPVGSNVGLGLNRPADPDLRLRGGRMRIEGVLEVPVLSYAQFGSDRLFSVTSTSWAEMEALLWQARRQEVPTIVLLTHPFEFIKGNRLDPDRQRRNRINQERLRRLCVFLAEHSDAFEAASFAGAAAGWLAAPDVPPPDLKAPLLPVLRRMVENKANDLVPAL